MKSETMKYVRYTLQENGRKLGTIYESSALETPAQTDSLMLMHLMTKVTGEFQM